jgi:hypothetical protein
MRSVCVCCVGVRLRVCVRRCILGIACVCNCVCASVCPLHTLTPATAASSPSSAACSSRSCCWHTQARELRRHLRPYFEDYSTGRTPSWYNALGMVMTSTVLNFYAASFGLLSLDYVLEAWAATGYYGLIGLGVAMVGLQVVRMLPGHRQKLEAHKAATAARAANRAR